MKSLKLQPDEINFLRQIKKELSFKSFREVLKRVTLVLRTFYQTLDAKQATYIVNQLPDFFKLAFVTPNLPSEKPIIIHHLDEFVNLLMATDKTKSIFKSEVEALSLSILVLKRVMSSLQPENNMGISPTLIQEINDVPSEAAAA